ncbi:MAG: hypothetical protein LKJ88_02880 [Bacilli bacterium]|jgi:hypothetical protein|nr:hypothetical protein [Bacilli bacterium]
MFNNGNFHSVKSMLPFLDEEDLELLAQRIMESPTQMIDNVRLENLYPFLDDDYLGTLLSQFLEKGLDITKLLPFVDDDDLSKLVDQIISGKGTNVNLNKLLPFLDDDDIKKLAAFLKQNGGSFNGTSLSSLLPFMDDDDIDDAFKDAWTNGKDFSKYLPFVSDEALSEAVDAYIHGNSSIDVNALYPFLEEDDLKKLFHYEINKKSN